MKQPKPRHWSPRDPTMSLHMLFVLSTICIGFVRTAWTYQGHTIVQPRHEYIIDPSQLGVHHKPLSGTFTIPAGIQLPDGSTTSHNHTLQGTLHLFLRAVMDMPGKRVLLRGFAYWDAVHTPQLWADLKLETPQEFNKWVPTLTLGRSRSTNTRKQYKLHVERAPDGTKPLSIFGEIPIQAASGVQVLHIEEWRRTWPLREVVATATPAADVNNSPPLFYTVVGQFYYLAHPLRYMKMHCDHHAAMGFNGTLMYVHSHHVYQFANDPVGHLLVEQGRLLLVRWDVVPNVEERPTYDQGIAHNHALLSLWQRNAWLFLTDLDELLVTPQPASVQQLLLAGGCLAGLGNILLLPEYDTLCEECFDSHMEGEERVWLADWSTQVLRKYTMRKKTPLSVKGLVDADATHQFFVHDGHAVDIDAHSQHRVHGTECAYVAHLRNLVYARVGNDMADEYERNVRDWLWVVPPDVDQVRPTHERPGRDTHADA